MAALSLRWRLSLAFAAVLSLLLALDIALTLLGAGRRIDPEVGNATALTSGVLRDATQGPDAAGADLDRRLADLAASFDRLRHVRVSYRARGRAGRAPAATRPEPPALVRRAAAPATRSPTTIAATVEGRRVGEFVVEGDPADEIGELWDSLVTLSSTASSSAALGFVVYFVVRAALAPLERLNAGFAALGRRDYGARLPERAAPEFAPLLARFNALGTSLQAAERENRVCAPASSRSRRRSARRSAANCTTRSAPISSPRARRPAPRAAPRRRRRGD